MAGNWTLHLPTQWSRQTFRNLSACFCCRSLCIVASFLFIGWWWREQGINTSSARNGRRGCKGGESAFSATFLGFKIFFVKQYIVISWTACMLQEVDIPYTSSLGLFEENILWNGFINTHPIDEPMWVFFITLFEIRKWKSVIMRNGRSQRSRNCQHWKHLMHLTHFKCVVFSD